MVSLKTATMLFTDKWWRRFTNIQLFHKQVIPSAEGGFRVHKHYLNLLTYNEMQSHLFRKTRLTADVERMAGVEPAENQFMRIKRRECGDARAGRRFLISRTHNTHIICKRRQDRTPFIGFAIISCSDCQRTRQNVIARAHCASLRFRPKARTIPRS